jgi:hypothetical protein
MNKKALIVWLLLFLMVSFLGAQSLAELSKKEQERRAALKSKATVVTNNDLGKVKKQPAVILGQSETAAEEVQGDQTTAPSSESPRAAANPRPPFNIVLPGASENDKTPSATRPATSAEEAQETKTALEENLAKAEEMVDLLTTKLNALWQQFYNMDDMGRRDKVQLEIGEMNNRLSKARADQARAEKELKNYVSRARK